MLYHTTLQRGSSVTSSTAIQSGDCVSVVANSLGSSISVVLRDGRVTSEVPLNGRLCLVCALKSGQSGQSELKELNSLASKVLAVTDKRQYSLLSLNAESGELKTLYSNSFYKQTASHAPSELFSSAAIASIAVLHVLQGSLQLFVAKSNNTVESSTLRIAELNVKHLILLPGSSVSRPILAILYADANDACFVSFHVIDSLNASLLATPSDSQWSRTIEVTPSTFKLAAVPAGGFLAFSESHISFFKDDIDATSTGTLLVSDSLSGLHLLDTTVKNGKMTRLGETSTASSITPFSETEIYIGSDVADSQIIHVSTPSSAEDSGVTVVHTFQNLAPIVDFAYLDPKGSGGVSKVIACCGFGPSGSLRVLSNGVGIVEIAELDEVVGVQGMWASAASLDASDDEWLVLSFFNETKVLCLDEDGALVEWEDETGNAGLCVDEATLLFGNVAYDQLVQVTASGLRLLSCATKQLRHEWAVDGDQRVVVASMNVNQVVLVVGGNRVVYFEIEEGALVEKGQIEMEYEVSCLDISCFKSQDSSKYFVAGMWTDNSIRIIDVSSMKECKKEVLSGDQLPRSVRFSTLGSTPYLLIGLGDGHLQTFTFDPITAFTANRKKLTLGTQPITLTPFHTTTTTTSSTDSSKSYLFSTSDQPSILYAGPGDKLMCSTVNLSSGSVTQVCQFRIPGQGSALAMASEDAGLVIGCLDSVQKMHVQRVSVGGEGGETPRRVVSSGASGLVGVLTYRRRGEMEDGDGDEVHYLKVFGEGAGWEVLDTYQFPDFEASAGFCALSVETDEEGEGGVKKKRELFVVGTAVMMEDSKDQDPMTGRVVVLEMDPVTKKLVVVCSAETKGVVYAVEAVGESGAIACAIGSKVQIYQLHQETFSTALVPICHHHGFIQALYLSVHGNYIAVGDLMKSATLLEYKPASSSMDEDAAPTTASIVEVARDYLPAWTTAVHAITPDLIVVGEAGNNLYTLRRQTDVQLDDEKRRLELVGAYHLGDFVNRIRSGSLAMNTSSGGASTDTATNSMRENSMLYCTVNGAFGSLVPVDTDRFRVLSGLQANLGKQVDALGGFGHAEWRTYTSDKRRIESMGYIDGDFVQTFGQLSEEEMEAVFIGEKNGGVKVEAESVEEVLGLLEEMALLS
ncbi:DNA damage-binding protein 1a [Rhizoclosmatium sp. JEL0117]|nr:DNA damage-binding protein 1a [Rhizoclosmatium sp. JEL0117]